ncbi:hypothetical protein RHAB21_02492 [Pseudorhizobium halotolerans]|uniref:Uncharacterized protein n=1 Tax=Pseudorhizobium halotolerans TaxID=1233081 RepID=A0ABN7JKT7_9HYPH|nr:hypothetical protein [Pseudorhizobium halotolerans]CAD7036179.1 hypothetical protein RHAB21_02492 [Pseudorhizobium halotolerans]
METLASWETWKSLLAFLSAAGLSIAAVVGAAYGLFRFLGERWINHKLTERLEAYRSEQARELERLRHKINGVFDRTKRLHDREFEVLPDVWGKLVEAESWAQSYLSGFRQYPDLRKLSDDDLAEFLEGTRFSEAQKRTIRDAGDPLKAYRKIEEMYRSRDAIEKVRDASRSLRKHGIFVMDPLRSDMDKLIDLIHAALIEAEMNHQHEIQPPMRDSYKSFKSEGELLFKKIEAGVRERLWDSATTEV